MQQADWAWLGSRHALFWVRTSMIVLALLAPPAAFLSIRLGFDLCVVLGPLAFPGPDALEIVIRVVCALILVASTAGMVFGFVVRQLREAAIFVLIFSTFVVIPTFLLAGFGDPGPNCVAG